MNVGFNKPDPPSERQTEENDDVGTIFVRGLASSVDDEKLLNRFSDVGPVRSAFVVRTGAGGESKGFGFVKFAIESDAQVAIETLNGAPMDGKILGVFPAQRRSDSNKQDDSHGTGKSNRNNYLTSEERQKRRLQEKDARHGRLEERIGGFSTELLSNTKRRLCVLLLWDTPTKVSGSKSSLKQWLSKRDIDVKRIKNIVLRIDKQDPMLAAVNISPTTAVEFENDKIAKVAYHRLKLANIVVRRHAAVTFKHTLRQRCRLIVRNLAWAVRENDLVTTFSKYGPIQETSVPTVHGNSKRIRGFGFVQFIFYSDAMKAIQNCNGHNIKGREIAVDWTISDDKMDADNSNGIDKSGTEEMGEGAISNSSNEDDNSSNKNDSSDDSDNDDDSNSTSSSSDADSSDDENDGHDYVSKAEKDNDTNNFQNNSVDGQKKEFSVFVQNLPFEATKKEVFEVFKRYGPCKMVKLVRVKATGQHRGSAFVHYYTELGVKTALAAGAGRIVKDINDISPADDKKLQKKRKKSKRDREIQGALAEAALNGGILINERKLNVLPALKQDELKSIEESREGNNERGKVDRRHLYLAKEGFIPESDGSNGSLQIPKGDRTKRDNIQKEKKLKLKNPNFFVSPTRLSIRNISTKPCRVPTKFLPPKHNKVVLEEGTDDENDVYKVVDGKLLKTIAINAARDGMRLKVVRRDEGDQTLMSTKDAIWEGKRVAVTEAKVVCDPLETYSDGTPVSRGYGFVEFTEHAHALAALRMLNNNPEYFMFTPGPSGVATPLKSRQRLIVEFSCEDARKLLKQKKNLEARKEKSLQRAAELGLNNNNDRKNKQKRKKRNVDDNCNNSNEEGSSNSKKKKYKKRNRVKSKFSDNDGSVVEVDDRHKGQSEFNDGDMDSDIKMDESSNSKERKKDKRSKTLKSIDKRGGSLSSRRERKKIKRSVRGNSNSAGSKQKSSEVNFDDLVSKYRKRLEKSNILQQGTSSSIKSVKKSRWFDEE